MQRYFAKNKINNSFILEDSDLYHIKTVMRMKNDDEIEVIYDKKLGEENKIIIDNVGAREYFKELTAVETKATFKTSLPQEQQYRGSYGVVFYLNFL